MTVDAKRRTQNYFEQLRNTPFSAPPIESKTDRARLEVALPVGFLALTIVLLLVSSPERLDLIIANALSAAAALSLVTLAIWITNAAGGLDLSVGSVAELGAAIFAINLAYSEQFWLSLIVALVLCALYGAVQGTIIGRWGAPSVVVTVGGMILGQGSIQAFSEVIRAISEMRASSVSQIVAVEGVEGLNQNFLGVPLLMIGGLIAVLIVTAMLRGKLGEIVRTLREGRGEQLNIVYGLSALLAGLGGIFFVIRTETFIPEFGQFLLFSALGAALLGKRAPILAVAVAVSLSILQFIVVRNFWPRYSFSIIQGLLILVALYLRPFPKRSVL